MRQLLADILGLVNEDVELSLTVYHGLDDVLVLVLDLQGDHFVALVDVLLDFVIYLIDNLLSQFQVIVKVMHLRVEYAHSFIRAVYKVLKDHVLLQYIGE